MSAFNEGIVVRLDFGTVQKCYEVIGVDILHFPKQAKV